MTTSGYGCVSRIDGKARAVWNLAKERGRSSFLIGGFSTTDALGRVEDFYYDAQDRMTGQVWYNAGGTVVYDRLTSTYDASGDLLTAANGAGTYTMTYNALNEITSVMEPNNVALSFAYDAAGDRTQMQEYAGGLLTGTVASTFDAYNRLTETLLTSLSGAEAEMDVSYTGNSMISTESRFSYPSATRTASGTTSYLYDSANLVTAIYQHYAAGTALASFLYAYDSDGRITGVTEGGSLVASYSYDASSELTSDGTVTYSYDGNGNRQNAGTVTYGAEAAGNELTNDGTWTYTYDAVGNVTEKYNGTDTWQYTYDNANHMLTAKETNGATTLVQATYTYDVFGNLIKEVYNNGSGATTVEHAYDMWNPANSLPTVWADQNGSNAITTQYLWGNQPAQLFANISSGGTLSWILTDRLGSTRYVTNAGGTSINDTISYDAWGNIKAGSTTSTAGMYLWTGMMQDPANTGLYHDNARFYSPTTGTWTTQDPLGLASGQSNLSMYVGNSPTNATDPSGLQPQPVAPAPPGPWNWRNWGNLGVEFVSGAFDGQKMVWNHVLNSVTLGHSPLNNHVDNMIRQHGPSYAFANRSTRVGVAAGETALGLAILQSCADAPFNPDNFIGSQATTPPNLPAGTYAALVVDGQVYVARMHITAWELAGSTGTEQFYGSAAIDSAGQVVRLFK